MKVLTNSVLLKLDKIEDKTKSGLYINTNEEDIQQRVGEVLQMGKDVTELKVGDRVVIYKMAGVQVEIEVDEDSEYRVIRDTDVLVVLGDG